MCESGLDIKRFRAELRELRIDHCQIITLPALKRMPYLTQIRLSCLDMITDIPESWGSLPVVEGISLWQMRRLTDISALGRLTTLTSLAIHCNAITDVTTLRTLTQLRYLNIATNQISDISALAGLTNLTRFICGNNPISDAAAVSGMTRLTQLSLGKSKLTELPDMRHLTALTMLNIGDNQISDISGIRHLTGLTQLEIPNMPLKHDPDVSQMLCLKRLRCDGSNVHRLDITGLTHLSMLRCSDNPLTEIVGMPAVPEEDCQLHIDAERTLLPYAYIDEYYQLKQK